MRTSVYRRRSLPRWGRKRVRWLPTVTPVPLAAGVASFVSSGIAGIVVTSTAAANGVPSYTYQWQRSTTSGSGFSDLSNGGGVSGATTLTLTDDSGVLGTLYYYRLKATDAAATIVYGNEVSAQVYEGGPLGTPGEVDDVTAQEIIDAVIQYGDQHWGTATGFAVPGDEMNIVDGGITDDKFTQPALVAGQEPAGVLGKIDYAAARHNLRRVKVDKQNSTITVYLADGTTPWLVAAYTSDANADDVGAMS